MFKNYLGRSYSHTDSKRTIKWTISYSREFQTCYVPNGKNGVIGQFKRVKTGRSDRVLLSFGLNVMINAAVVMHEVRVHLEADCDGTASDDGLPHARLVAATVESTDVTVIRGVRPRGAVFRGGTRSVPAFVRIAFLGNNAEVLVVK